jgi:hypothetical protein
MLNLTTPSMRFGKLPCLPPLIIEDWQVIFQLQKLSLSSQVVPLVLKLTTNIKNYWYTLVFLLSFSLMEPLDPPLVFPSQLQPL